MRSVHSLEILHRVPIVLHEDHDVCTGQGQAEPAHSRSENKDTVRYVVVELVHDLHAVSRTSGALKCQMLDAELNEHFFDYNVLEGLHLAEYQRSMR